MSNVALNTSANEATGVERTLVIPVYKNEENIPYLIKALEALNEHSTKKLEVIFVIDASPDHSGNLLLRAQKILPFPTSVIFHSRNFGSFTAARTGMELVNSDAVAVMAADLQEPPELILKFFEIIENDEADVVFGTRTGRHDSWLGEFFSSVFWALYRKMVIKDIPKGGIDVFGCNRRVLDAVLAIREPNSSLMAQLFWVGFRRSFVPYERREREHGESAWSFSRRMRYMMDSIFSFSDFPILMVMWIGAFGCLASFGFGLFTILGRLTGFIEQPGYAGLAVLITFSTSLLLLVQGIIGSYLWRTFENTKKRPLSIVSDVFRSSGHPDAHRGEGSTQTDN